MELFYFLHKFSLETCKFLAVITADIFKLIQHRFIFS
jgi:hypothetical protein